MKQTLMEAGEGQRGTHMGFINAVVPVSNHLIHWRARLRASLTRIRDNDKGVYRTAPATPGLLITACVSAVHIDRAVRLP